MKTSSAKAKGRLACQELRESLLRQANHLEADDIRVTPSGCTGEDLWLSPKAREAYPYVFEVKNQENISIWAAFKQALDHWNKYINSEREVTPILAFKRNRTDLHVMLTLEDFLKLTRKDNAEG